MKRKLYGKRRFYNDELKDDFGHDFTDPKPAIVGKDYRFLHNNPIFKLGQWVILHLIAKPIFWLYGKIVFHVKIEGKNNLRAFRRLSRRTGVAVYANHVYELDAVFYYAYTARSIPHIIVSPGAFKIPVVRHLITLFGAIPLPEDLEAFRGFNRAIDTVLAQKRELYVLPEAHLWPMYAGVRNFTDTSFRYAARNHAPVVPMAITFRKRGGRNAEKKKPYMTIHIGEAIEAPGTLSAREQATFLRDRTYEWIAARANSPENFAVVDYVRTDIPVNMAFQLEVNKKGAEYTP